MTDPRAAYLEASIATASPERLLVMLYDRLVLDLTRALEAQRAGDQAQAHPQLLHAQDIVIELRVSLKVEEWEGGPGLASLYDFMFQQLVRANVAKDASLTESCLGLAQDLASTWRQAALEVGAAALAS